VDGAHAAPTTAGIPACTNDGAADQLLLRCAPKRDGDATAHAVVPNVLISHPDMGAYGYGTGTGLHDGHLPYTSGRAHLRRAFSTDLRELLR
jgi:hypothetical protein